MNIDVLNLTEAQLNALSYDQKEALYKGQEQKNAMVRKLEKNKNAVLLNLIALGAARSNALKNKTLELTEEYEKELEELQIITLNAILQADSTGGGTVEEEEYAYDKTSPDYSLETLDRFVAVKEYYMSVENPLDRYEEFLNDTAVKDYLGEYYSTMDYYLRSFI